MGKTFLGQPDGPSDRILDSIWTLFSCKYFPRRLKLRTELLLSCFSLSLFFSCVSLSLPQFFKTPHTLTPLVPIYRLPSVGLSWWWEGLFMLVGPFWDIFLTKWDPLLTTDMTISKVAPVANGVWQAISPKTLPLPFCTGPNLVLILEFIWAPFYHWAHNS